MKQTITALAIIASLNAGAQTKARWMDTLTVDKGFTIIRDSSFDFKITLTHKKIAHIQDSLSKRVEVLGIRVKKQKDLPKKVQLLVDMSLAAGALNAYRNIYNIATQ